MKPLAVFSDEIYEHGGFYDDLLTRGDCLPLEIAAPSAVACIGHVYERGERPVGEIKVVGKNEIFRKYISDRYESFQASRAAAPRCIAVSIESCYIYGSIIYGPANEGLDVIYETFRSTDQPWVPVLDRSNPFPQITRHYDGRNEPVLFLGSSGSRNYGHWLVDDLPRAKAVASIGNNPTILLTSFGEVIDKVRRASLDAALKGAGPYRIEMVGPDDIVQVDRLTYVSPTSFHSYIKNQNAMEFVRSLAPSNVTAGLKLFVTRSPDRYRKLLNLSAVEEALCALGFVTVDPETLTFEEQTRTFAGADVVVGVMCAAMTNTIFCKSGSKLIYLAPEPWDELFYWDLAMTMGHRYAVVYGPRAGNAQEPFYDDFSIDLNLVREAIGCGFDR